MSTPDLPAVQWRKSSSSGHDGGDCVEVAALHAIATPYLGSIEEAMESHEHA